MMVIEIQTFWTKSFNSFLIFSCPDYVITNGKPSVARRKLMFKMSILYKAVSIEARRYEEFERFHPANRWNVCVVPVRAPDGEVG